MLGVSIELRDARMFAIIGFLARGGSAGHLFLYPAPRPTVGGAPTRPALVDVLINVGSWSVNNAVLTLSPGASGLIEISGDAAWGRLVNGAGDVALDFDVTDDTGAGEAKLPSVTLRAGGRLDALSFSLVG